METTSPSERPGAQRYRVARGRTRRTAAHAHHARARRDRAAAAQLDRRGHPRAGAGRADRARVRPEPGRRPTASPTVQRITRSFPEVGVVLLADELTLHAAPGRAARRRARRAHDRRGRAPDPARGRAGRRDDVGRRRTAPRPRRPSRRGWADLRRVLDQGWRRQERRRDQPRGAARDPQSRAGSRSIDADLQFGDDAVLLGVPPQHTSADAAAVVETIDAQLMDGFLATARGVDAAGAVRAGRAGRR